MSEGSKADWKEATNRGRGGEGEVTEVQGRFLSEYVGYWSARGREGTIGHVRDQRRRKTRRGRLPISKNGANR